MRTLHKRRASAETQGPSLDDGDAHRVAYEFLCPDRPEQVVVHSFNAIEELNRPYMVTVQVEALDETIDLSDFLGRDAVVCIYRGEHGRSFFGIVGRVRVDGMGQSGPLGTLEIVPALWALRLTEDSRVFQDRMGIEIVETVLNEKLSPFGRRVDTTSVDRERYLAREYCVQYRESALDFVHRLLEEDGIGYFFRHDKDGPETIVLFDDNSDLTRVSTMNQGPVRFDPTVRAWAGFEPVMQFRMATVLTPSRVTIRDHDWIRARSMIESASADEGAPTARHACEVYEHGFDRQLTIREDHELAGTLADAAIRATMPFGPPPDLAHRVYEFPGIVIEGISMSNAAHQLAIRHQRHRRDARTSYGVGVVTGFAPGCVFELVGHPTLGADGEYLLTKVLHTSAPPSPASETEGEDGVSHNYECEFECLPIGTRWRPDRRTPKPRIYGVQTARVTGPLGMDVHTDPHGRIKVCFHWDRAPNDLAGNYSCWVRVSHVWAGQGAPGFMFIPRVGMEVVVSFIDGDPDRPLVTGCVHNGANPTPGMLPVQATKSIIRTRTVPHGTGYNEISFEDARGMERVHLRAQRDLEELVLNDHLTNVGRSQANRVRVDQVEEVGRDQQLHVHGDRTLTVTGNHVDHCSSDRLTTTHGSESASVAGDYHLDVEEGSYQVDVGRGVCTVRSRGPIILEQNEERFVQLSSDEGASGITIQSDGSLVRLGEGEIELKVGRSHILMTPHAIQINGKTFPAVGGRE